ncbi:MAG: hypothetical protein IT437_10390 [Phycisphaerales bacterium]|nr:hypothetical protein [Phycisphaerales bacterium]
MPALSGLLVFLAVAAVGIFAAVILVMYILVPAGKGVYWLVSQVARFIVGEVGDVLRLVGAVITTIAFVPLTVGSVIFGRWSAASHYGRAIQGEVMALGRSVYRIAVGHPARLLCLTGLTEGLERRLPEAVAAAPGADKPPRGRAGQFDGYRITGSLPGGGSGGRLYVAEPDEIKRAGFERAGQRGVGQVVIKTFSLSDGSSLPQVVRESRALEAAKKLGLVLEHDLSDERFYYVTRYVPGESLTLVTQRLHAAAGPGGLGNAELHAALGYTADLLLTLDTYHRGGLWHKDVKPDNIVVDRQAAHLVDFGLVSSLRSAMTLTTHGTEYFRDPEMVRMALKGVKVHQVNGAKFDVFGAGAVMFSVIENSFPAHGGLSKIGLRCPEAVRWIVRRAMTDYDHRYESAGEMLADVQFVREASDPFAVRPADLPSMGGASRIRPQDDADPEFHQSPERERREPEVVAAAASPVPPREEPRSWAVPAPDMPSESQRRRPRVRLTDWWSGRYAVDGMDVETPAAERPHREHIAASVRASVDESRRQVRSAAEQLERAHARMQAARHRAHERMASRRQQRRRKDFAAGFNPGMSLALFLFLAVVVGLVLLIGTRAMSGRVRAAVSQRFDAVHGVLPPSAPVAPVIPASTVEGDGRFHTELRAAAPAPALVPVDGRVLVVSDLQPPLSADVQERLTAALDRVRAAGMAVYGDEAGDDQVDLESQARSVRGLLPLDSPDAATAIGTWLSQVRVVDAVLWWAPGEAAGAPPRFALYQPLEESGRVGDKARRAALARAVLAE